MFDRKRSCLCNTVETQSARGSQRILYVKVVRSFFFFCFLSFSRHEEQVGALDNVRPGNGIQNEEEDGGLGG